MRYVALPRLIGIGGVVSVLALLLFVPTAAAAPSISAAPGTLQVGQPLTVSWTGSADARDWIGLFWLEDGSRPDWQYVDCRNTPAGVVASGSCTFHPPQAGTYEARLYRSDTWTLLATSGAVTVSPSSAQIGFTLGAGADWVGTPVTVSWTGSTSPRDWIGVFRQSDGARLDFRFVNCGSSPGSTVVASGTCTLPLPSPPGTYEFRLLADGTWNVIATSAPARSEVLAAWGPTVRSEWSPQSGTLWATWSGAAYGLDWVGLFHGADGARADFCFVSVAYRTGGLPYGGCYLRPDGPGEYEVRLYGNNTWYLIATSDPVAVP